MKRLLFNDLIKWRTSHLRMPLLLRGARQVGKTHVVRELGKDFASFIEINFEKQPFLAKIFDYDLDPARITKELSIALQVKIEAGKSLLFLDEIQVVPNAILALRYFYEEMPQLHIIAAGSLVDFAIEKVGVPVGRISFLYMYPMSFIEFLYARGYQSLATEIVNHTPDKTISPVIHEKSLRLLGEYMAIGGMPKAVYQWVTNENIQDCASVLTNIKNTYEQDFEKYAKKNEIKYVDFLFKHIPKVVGESFKYSNLSDDYRKRELEPSLHLLEKAGILHQVFHSSGNGVPLGAEMDLNKFKLILLDTGLCQNLLGLDLKDWFINPNIAFINKGKIAESYVGQEMLAYMDPQNKSPLYYWHREARHSNAEVDYLLNLNGEIIPIEVKSGHGATLQSMRIFLQSHSSSYGIRFSIHNYSIFDKIHSYPLYAVSGMISDKDRLLKFLTSG